MVRFYVSFWRQEISMKQKTFRCGRSRHLEFRGIGTALSRQKSFELQTGVRQSLAQSQFRHPLDQSR